MVLHKDDMSLFKWSQVFFFFQVNTYSNIVISVDRWTRHCLCLFQSPELIGEIVEWPTEGESLQGASTKSITRDRKGATDVHKTTKFVD